MLRKCYTALTTRPCPSRLDWRNAKAPTCCCGTGSISQDDERRAKKRRISSNEVLPRTTCNTRLTSSWLPSRIPPTSCRSIVRSCSSASSLRSVAPFRRRSLSSSRMQGVFCRRHRSHGGGSPMHCKIVSKGDNQQWKPRGKWLPLIFAFYTRYKPETLS